MILEPALKVGYIHTGLSTRAIPSPLLPQGITPSLRVLTWKSSSSRISFRHLIKKAAQTYRWKWENPSGSDCGQETLGERLQLSWTTTPRHRWGHLAPSCL